MSRLFTSLKLLCFALLAASVIFQFTNSSMQDDVSSLFTSVKEKKFITKIGKAKDGRIKETDGTPFLSFNTSNPHSESWCPYATCNNSPLCLPCQRRYLFIFATGRSGSTSLLKMLNFLPSVRLSGENMNQLFTASKLLSNIRSKKNILDQNVDQKEGAWAHNAISPQSVSCSIQGVLNAINPPPKKVQQNVNVSGHPSIEEFDRNMVLGAKTIRYQNGEWNVKESAEYMKENFPCSRIVINIRSNVTEQLKSTTENLKGDKKRGSRTHLELSNQFLIKLSKELGDEMSRIIDMNEWTKDIEILNDLVTWLGFRGCTYKQIVHENSEGYHRDKDTDPGIDKICLYPE